MWAPVEQKSVTPGGTAAPKPAKYVVDGISLGARVSFKSNDYQEYQCTPSEQFEGVTWCNKQRVEEEARGSYRSSYTIAHSRDGTIYYLNQFLEPAFFNAGEVDNEIERLSGKFGEPTTQRIGMPRGLAAVDGLIATWGRVTLESLDSTAINELAAGRILLREFWSTLLVTSQTQLDGACPFTGSAGAQVSSGRQALILKDAGPCVSSQLIRGLCCQARPKRVLHRHLYFRNPQNDCDRLAANPSDQRKPPSIPGVPYDILMNQAKDAIAACTLAVQQSPTEPRYEYQMARAMETEAPEKAFEIHNKLAHLGYPVAYDNLGWLEIKLHKNFGEAIKDFEAGSQLQDPDSIVSLVEMIDKGYVPTDRPQELKCQLLRRAADLGHQGAQGEYEEKCK